MPIVAEYQSSVFVLSVSPVVLAGGVGLALILLVVWVGLLYSKVLRLTGEDQAHGLNVLKELTELIKAAFEPAKPRNKADE